MLKKIFYTVVVLTVGIFLFAWIKSNYFTDRGFDKNPIVQYRIAGIDLDIPRNYHYGKYELFQKWPDVNEGRHDENSARIVILFPTFESVDQKNLQLFQRRGLGQKIRITIEKFDSYHPENKINNLERANALIKNLEPKFGLIHYKEMNTFNGNLKNDLFMKYQDNEVVISAECGAMNLTLMPSCQFNQVLTNNIRFSYYFSREYLPQWQKIDTEVKKLLSSFCSQKNDCFDR